MFSAAVSFKIGLVHKIQIPGSSWKNQKILHLAALIPMGQLSEGEAAAFFNQELEFKCSALAHRRWSINDIIIIIINLSSTSKYRDCAFYLPLSSCGEHEVGHTEDIIWHNSRKD